MNETRHEVDEYSQAMPDYDGQANVRQGAHKSRGTKGNRKEQAKRYRVKHRGRLKDYKRRYMREWMRAKRSIGSSL